MKKNALHTIIPMALVAVLASAASSYSQDKRVEINPFVGYSFSDGVTIQPLELSGEIYDTVDVKDGASFGFQFGVYVNENIEVGFLYSRQQSTLTGRGTATTDFTDMPISNYHGVVTYNFSTSDALARPFLFGGLGATHYSPEDAQNTAVDSETRFSTTWGLGVKIYPSPTFGISLMGRWTPTYIKSDPGGIWCGYYGCWVLADAQYSNQFELSAGLSLRF